MCAGFPFWIEDYETDDEKPEKEELAYLRGIFSETIKAAHGNIGEDWLSASEESAASHICSTTKSLFGLHQPWNHG